MGGSTYAAAGVVLLVVGCLLSILATARRTARPRSEAVVRAADVRTTSASVERLRRDVSRWAKSG